MADNRGAKIRTATVTVRPPGEPGPVEIEVDVASFSLREWQTAKKALKLMTDPSALEIAAVNAWIVWHRDHPDCSLDEWIDVPGGFGHLLGLDLGDLAVLPPEGFDPEA